MTAPPLLIGDVDDVTRTMLARWTLAKVAIGVVIGALIGVAYVLAIPPTFRAVVAVELTEVQPVVDLGGSSGEHQEISIDTDAQLAGSDAVVAAAAAADGVDAATARSRMHVSARPLTRVLEITYESDRADDAVQASGAAAAELLAERQRLVIQPVRDYLTSVITHGTDPQDVVDPAAQPDVLTPEARRRLALDEELRLPGPGSVLEASHLKLGHRPGQIEVPVATGAAVGGLVAFGMVTWSRRRRRAGR